MANISYADMKKRVARKLGVIADGADLSADDGTLIGQALVDVQEQVAQLFGMAVLNVEDCTESRYADPIAQMAAALLVDEYGVPEPRRSQIIAAGSLGVPGRSLAERKLRALIDNPTVKLLTYTDVTVV